MEGLMQMIKNRCKTKENGKIDSLDTSTVMGDKNILTRTKKNPQGVKYP